MNVRRRASQIAALAGALLLIGVPASAQFTSQWAATPAPANVLQTVDYDDKHDVYLQVWEAGGAATGRFVNASGQIVGAPFIIGTHRFTFSGVPRVAYSTGTTDDVFLVVYYSDVNGANVFGQRVRYTGTGATGGELVGGTIAISPSSNSSNCINRPNDVAYNPAAQRFLVSYIEYPANGACPTTDSDLFVRSFGPDGAALTNPVNISAGAGWQHQGIIGVDWQRNLYLIAFCGDRPGTTNDTQLGLFAKVLDGTSGQPVSSLITMRAGYNVEPSVAYLPERDGFLVAFTGIVSTTSALGRFVPSTTTSDSLGEGAYIAINTSSGTGAPSLAYDYVSRKVLIGAMSEPKYVRGAVLSATGSPETNGFLLNSDPQPGTGSFFPQVRSAENGFFAMSYIVDYLTVRLEGYQLPAASSPGPKFGSGGTTPVSNIQVNIDSPTGGQIVNGTSLTLTGYALDRGASSGTGIDEIHVWKTKSGGSAEWVDKVTPTNNHTGAFNLFGSQFANSGFSVPVTGLSDGTWTISVHPHSTVTNTFGTARTVTVTVSSSLPLIAIDTPQNNAQVGPTFTLSGWALDRGATSGTGVNTVHVWAFPQGGGAGTFFAVATLGGQRSDVGNVFGAQFSNAGFSATNTTPLAPGAYFVVAYLHSSVTGNFERTSGVNVTVAAAVSAPLTRIDTPSHNSTLGSRTFTISGWSLDQGSTNGPGMNVLHIWAFRVSDGFSQFLEVGNYGQARSDVANAFGHSRFTNSGFSNTVTLPTGGTWDIVVFGHSGVTGAFQPNPAAVRVTVP
jgi:hypothetical protein